MAFIKRIKGFNHLYIKIGLSVLKADSTSVFVYFATFIMVMFAKSSVLSIVVTNVYLLMVMYLSVCAVSLIDYYFKYKFKIILPVRIIVIGIIFIIASSLQILPLIAIVDSIKDFRKLSTKGENNEK